MLDSGPSGASILVGQTRCLYTQHDAHTPHTKLRCTLSSGNQLARTIIVITKNGATSTSPASVSYHQCNAVRVRFLAASVDAQLRVYPGPV